MARTKILGSQIKDNTIQRTNIDTATSGQALTTKIIAGAGVSLSSTGADSGTGDVTITAGTSEYITNYNAEVNTTGWSNSGSNFTISRTTTSGEVLRGTASFKLTANGSQAVNDYISTSFTLDPGDTSSLLALQFYFKGISSYDTGDVEVVLHDGTSEIIPHITQIPSGGIGLFQAVWISNSNTSYTLRFKAKVTTAFSLSIDEVYVRRKEVVQGAAISKTEQDNTLTISAGFGTPSNIAIYKQIVGDKLKVWGGFTTGTVAGSVISINLPSGNLIDYTKIPSGVSSRIGEFATIGSTPSSLFSSPSIGVTFVDGTTTDKVFFAYKQNSNVYEKVNGTGILNSNAPFDFSFEVPLVGYSADVVLQNSRVEFASNNSTNNGDDTSSYSHEINGSVIPAVTNIYRKQVEFLTPIQQTDDIEIQADWDAQGIWNRWEDQSYDDAVGKYGPTWEYESGSKTKINVWMRGGQYARYINSTGTARTFAQENAAGSRWRVRKTANPLAVESPNTISKVQTISANTTLDTSYRTILVDTTSSSKTITLPPASTNNGTVYQIKNIGVNSVTVNRSNSDLIDGQTSISIPSQYGSFKLETDGVSNWYAMGSLWSTIVNKPNRKVTITFNAGTSLLTSGAIGTSYELQAGTIKSWILIADQSGSCSINIAKSTVGTYPSSSSIVASAPPTLTSQAIATSSTLTGWTTSISSGDILIFTLSSVSNLHRVVLVLEVSQ
jgi:hypothetical protein